MDRKLAEQFNNEINGYRNSLLYYAKASNWEEFEIKAGRLFDYVETVEFSELERRFFNIFNPILMVMAAALLALLGLDFETHQGWISLKNAFVFTLIVALIFELFFFLNYRMYIGRRTQYYEKRRKKFIRSLRQDFRCYARMSEERRAA